MNGLALHLDCLRELEDDRRKAANRRLWLQLGLTVLGTLASIFVSPETPRLSR